MTAAITILTIVMGIASLGMMFMATCEFVVYLRNNRTASTSAQSVASPMQSEVKETTPVAEVEEKVQDKIETTEAAVSEDTDSSVSFELSDTHRQTLSEAYDKLKGADKKRYNKIVDASKELPMARIIESTYAYTVMQGRANIARLRILRGIVTLDCTVINPDLVKYNKENGKKIHNKPMRFRIRDDQELDAAIYTMRVANQTSLDNRKVRRNSAENEG